MCRAEKESTLRSAPEVVGKEVVASRARVHLPAGGRFAGCRHTKGDPVPVVLIPLDPGQPEIVPDLAEDIACGTEILSSDSKLKCSDSAMKNASVTKRMSMSEII